MKRYTFKFEHIKLNAEFLGLTYSHVLKAACFQNNNYPASTNTNVLNHTFDFSNQFTKDIWFNIYNGKYEVLIEYPEFESDTNSPKLEINKTFTITPNNEDEEDLAYEEQIIINRACGELYKTLPVEYLKTAGFNPGFNFYDEAYIWTNEQRSSMWSSFIGELQITLISIE